MIHDLIKKGEGKTIEFKVDFPKNNQITKTICAFANRAGGYLVIGIDDENQIVGINNNQVNDYLEKLPNIIHDSIYPMLLPEIYTYTIEEKRILVIQVYPSSNTPHYLKEKGKLEGTYVRVGRTNKQADIEMIKDLERHRINKSFDEDIYGELLQDDLRKLKSLIGKHLEQDIPKEKLINLHLVESLSGQDYLTNVGAILLGKLANTSIRCARFAGNSTVNFIDKKEYDGDLFTVYENVIVFIKNHIHISGMIEGNGPKRNDIFEIPEAILREGVINAIVHRDYSISGSDIKIAVFDERIEITSPGGFPKTLSVEEIYAGRSEIRNRLLCNIFLKAGFVEQWGSGVPRMRELSRSVGLKEPEIAEHDLFVVLSIYRRTRKALQHRTVYYDMPETETKTYRVKEEKNLIYNLLEEDGKKTVRDISKVLNISEASVQRRLQSLQKDKRIKRVGSKKTGYWKT